MVASGLGRLAGLALFLAHSLSSRIPSEMVVLRGTVRRIASFKASSSNSLPTSNELKRARAILLLLQDDIVGSLQPDHPFPPNPLAAVPPGFPILKELQSEFIAGLAKGLDVPDLGLDMREMRHGGSPEVEGIEMRTSCPYPLPQERGKTGPQTGRWAMEGAVLGLVALLCLGVSPSGLEFALTLQPGYDLGRPLRTSDRPTARLSAVDMGAVPVPLPLHPSTAQTRNKLHRTASNPGLQAKAS